MKTSEWIMEAISNILDLGTLISILIIILAASVIIKIGDRILLRVEKNHDIDLTTHYLFKDILKYTVILIAFAWILHLIGIDLQNIILSLGIAGIVLGIASKDIVSNFISGIFVISDKKIKVGETIDVDGRMGTIQKVGFRNTTLKNQDKQIITIPNSLLSTKAYKNYLPNEENRIRLMIVLPHGLDIYEFEKRLDEKIQSYEWIDKSYKIKIKAQELLDAGPKIEVSYWVNDFDMIIPGKLIILEESNQIINEYLEKIWNL